MKVVMIDPPRGWRYGFPKALPNPPPEDTRAWLIENGYPAAMLDKMGEHFYCGYWEQEVPDPKGLDANRGK